MVDGGDNRVCVKVYRCLQLFTFMHIRGSVNMDILVNIDGMKNKGLTW